MHKHGRAFLFLLGCLLSWASASGQCPQPGFTAPDTVCINQAFSTVNTSTGANRYQWDFCPGDLVERPAVTEVLTLPGVSIPAYLTTITDGSNWYAFFLSRDNNRLFRLDFGNSVSNAPTLVNVGLLDAVVSSPEPLDFVKEGDDWYALTANTFGNSNLIRLHFGASLRNVPSVTDLGNFGGRLRNPRGLKVAHDDGQYVAVLTNNADNTLVMVNFGNSIRNTPGTGDVLKTGPLGAGLELIGTDLVRDCNQWYGLTVAKANSQVFKLSFGETLFSLPAINPLPINGLSGDGLFNVELAYDGGFTAMLMSLDGRTVHVNLGESMADNNPVATDFGRLPLAGILGFSVVRNGAGWLGYCTSYTTNRMYRLTFPNRCGSQPSLSDQETPSGFRYDSPGTKNISLTAYGPEGEKSLTKSVFVSSGLTFDFTVEGSPAQFTAVPGPGMKIVDWQWNFDDGTTASGPAVTHDFSRDAVYNISLTAKSACGEEATVSRKLGVVNNTALACPLPSFSLPDTVCSNTPFDITNTSRAAERFEWDFCSGDLERAPAFGAVSTLDMMGTALDIEVAHDGTNWFGFVCSWGNNKVYRLNFGNQLTNVPTVTDLGNIGGLLNLPVGLSIVKEGSTWYGLLVNVLGNSTRNLVRLNFGSSLTNVPTGANIPAVSALLNNPRNLELVRDNGRLVALIPASGNNKLVVVNFKDGITYTPSAADIVTVDFSGNPLPWDIAVTKECNKWYAFMIGNAGKLFRLEFGSNLFSRPAIRDISTVVSGQGSPVKINLYKDVTTHAFVFTQTGNFFRLGFGNDVTGNAPTLHPIDTKGILTDGQALALVKNNSVWEGFMINWQSKRLVRVAFPEGCNVNTRTSVAASPANIAYSGGGWQKISLTAYDWNNNVTTSIDSVFTRPAVSGAFSTRFQCVGAETVFRADPVQNGNRIAAYEWNFGNGNFSTEPSPRRNFPQAGTYPVTLTIRDMCGGAVTRTQPVVIYPNMVPGFAGPDAVCSSDTIRFAGTVISNGDTPAAWHWDFGNGSTATGQRVSYSYPVPGSYTATLTVTGISGCSATVSKPVRVTPGVGVNFAIEGTCFGDVTTFRDQSVVAEGTTFVSREWHFGDGAVSAEENPVHEYVTSGTYIVSLTIKTASGCALTRSQTIRVKQLPRVAFSHALACSGEAVLFSDESSTSEGGLAAWQWDFGDPGSGAENASSARNPSHTFSQPGDYLVKLRATTSQGCRDSVIQRVTVLQSPRADFSALAGCGDRNVSFTHASSAGPGAAIENWYWEFGDGGTSAEPNPVHAYEKAGTYEVTLFITSSTRCAGVVKRTVSLYDPPVADFSLPAPVCADVPAAFADASKTAPGDAVTGWEWDFGAGGKQSGPSPAVSFAAGGASYPVTLTVTTASGCRSTITKTVAVQATPGAGFTFEPAGPLEPLKISFANASSADAVAFEWHFGDGQTAAQRDPVHVYEAAGTYTVALTARNAAGCRQVYAQEVTVNNSDRRYDLKLEASLVQPAGAATALQVKLFNNSAQTIHAVTFRVTPQRGTALTQGWSGTLQPGRQLSYRIELPAGTVAEGEPVCVVARDETNEQYSNRECVSAWEQFTLLAPFPNPTDRVVHLGYILPTAGRVLIRLTDALGREVHRAEVTDGTPGYHEHTLDLPGLSKGIYLVRVRFEGREQVRKVFVH